MNLEVKLLGLCSNVEKRGIERVLEVLRTCDWNSSNAEDDDSIRSLQDAELDFELNAFDDDKLNGSEWDVEYVERMMDMLISARGKETLSSNS